MKHAPALFSLLAGAGAAAGFAPLGWWPLALVALAGWLLLLHGAPTLRAALWRGWLFGVAHFTWGNSWIQHAFDFQDKMPPWLGYGAVVGLALYLAVYPMLAAGAAWYLRERDRPGPAFVMAAAGAWIVTEWLRATMFTGYAWNPLAVMWVPTPLGQAAAWTGTYGLSGITVLIAGGLLLLARARWWPATALLLPAVAAAGALALLPAPGADPAGRRVRVVQPNIGQERQSLPGYADEVLATMLSLSGTPGAAPRLVVWPEGTVHYYLEDRYPVEWYREMPGATRARIAGVLGPRDVALVGGTSLFFDAQGEVEAAGNSVFAVTDAARLAGRYDKSHLVPYGEYLPMRPILEPLGLSRLVAGEIDFRPGPGPRTIAIAGFGGIGMQICYEIIFSGRVAARGDRPALLFNPSNDAWFGAAGPPQHLAQARLRAIEEGLPILRSTPTGISAVIDARGRLLASIPQGVRGAIELPMPAPLPPTLFARWGNGLAGLLALALIVAAIALRRSSRYGRT